MMNLFAKLWILFFCFTNIESKTVWTAEVFTIEITPWMFNWTVIEMPDQFIYQPSLVNKPDLPNWISYIKINYTGYLYGVPPDDPNTDIEVEVIALSRLNYETRRISFPIFIKQKQNPATHEVQLKVDNLNVYHMFNERRMQRLKEVFWKRLWRDTKDDLYVTFLQSAIQLGARLPLKPNEGEGVVLRLGSQLPFSTELTELQEEVKPLWKLQSCPRDFKYTTVERLFREAGFELDWCAFRLLENDDGSAMQHSSSHNENHMTDGNKNFELKHRANVNHHEYDKWKSIGKDEVPQRSYINEFVFTIVIPMLILLLLVLVLSLILCFHHEGINDTLSDEFFDSVFHICVEEDSSKRSTSSSRNYQQQCLRSSHEYDRSLNMASVGQTTAGSISLRSHTNSPNSSLAHQHHHDGYLRPSPPPYVPTHHKQQF